MIRNYICDICSGKGRHKYSCADRNIAFPPALPKELDKRNVYDKYKNWQTDLIREDINKKKFPYAVAMQHINGDFNISTFWRNANFFGASKVFYIGGKKKIDIRGCCGVQHYTDITHLKSIDDLSALKEKYTFVGIENNVEHGTIYKLNGFYWPAIAEDGKEILILFGEEGGGLLPEVIKMCKYLVEIPGFGSVRSINVGSCSAIVMNDVVSKYLK